MELGSPGLGSGLGLRLVLVLGSVLDLVCVWFSSVEEKVFNLVLNQF